MITQDIIDKLKVNEIPYGILKTKDWFTDKVDKFMNDNIAHLIYYDWPDKWFDIDGNRFPITIEELYKEWQLYKEI